MKKFEDALSKVDILLTSGGVSMGEKVYLSIQYRHVVVFKYRYCAFLQFSRPTCLISSIMKCLFYSQITRFS